MTIVTDFYSDIDMQCPASYYGGYKEARVTKFGSGERMLSNMRTGEWSGSTFSFQISDYDRSIRQRLASANDKYWSEPLTIRMVDRGTRKPLGAPYTVFVGPIIDAQPTRPLAWDITLGDVVSRGLLSDDAVAPWRRIGDGFLDQLTTVADGLDRDTPEPVIYGKNVRVPGIDPPSGEGLVISPTYLGTWTIGGTAYHVWLVAGHACADIPDLRVDTVSKIGNEGTDWFVPHHAGWSTVFATANYVDLRSSTFGNTRRYTLVLGKVGNADPDGCADGSKSLTLNVWGVEPNGDGTGPVIEKRILQYKHFTVNYIANQGQNSYQSGAWLTSPTWSLFDGPVSIVDEASFDTADAIAFERFPVDVGYTGAGVVGAKAGERKSLKAWIADWNRSCSVRFGITHKGQIRVVMLHPTTDVKAAAPLIEDADDILQDSFTESVHWDEQANRVPFKADFNHVTGQWMTTNAADDPTSIVNYNKVILGEDREYPFAPGITAANHLAVIELRTVSNPPRTVVLETNLAALGTMDIGDYVRYRHFAGVGTASNQIRLGMIQRHQVQAGTRRVQVELLDVEDLIGFDTYVAPPAGTNPACASAIALTAGVPVTIDTTANPTDASMASPPGPLPAPGIAYHAAWFTFTNTSGHDGILWVDTRGSSYDTQIAILTGTCGGSWTLMTYNDNEEPLKTSRVGLAGVIFGETVYILVYGYGPDDGGTLVVNTSFS